MMATFDARKWVRDEVEATMDSYENTRQQAEGHVYDMITEGNYDDALTDDQQARAMKWLQHLSARRRKL